MAAACKVGEEEEGERHEDRQVGEEEGEGDRRKDGQEVEEEGEGQDRKLGSGNDGPGSCSGDWRAGGLTGVSSGGVARGGG